MKFKFTLEKVLKHREIQVGLAQKDFGEAQNFLREETIILQNMIDTKNSSLEQRSRLVQQSQDWTVQVEQINLFLIGQDLRIKKQNQRLTEIEKLVESKREILRQAMTEVKILEKLREKKHEEFVKAETRQEQSDIDELTALRFSRTESLIKGSHEDGI